ncbi:centrosomal protein of 70 kDa [Ambystoma mexicanum]|uniref:centrosomal protein of 70 kDa n=1 Tax=Ambystoma mexicanum TaxID=8296 RepID=UPI0037E9A4E0
MHEQEEWENINKLLKRHGFSSVCLTKLRDTGSSSDVAVLDKQSSLQIRSALKSLIEDTERQQALIHGLVQSNTQLKDDLRQQQGRASRQEQRAVDLERILENVKSKIRSLEDDFITKASQHHTQLMDLQKDKQVAQTRYNQQKEKLNEHQETISCLQKKLLRLITEDDQRVARQNKVFLQLQDRAPRAHSTIDQQILDIIDSYESQINRLQKELRRYEDCTDGTEVERKDSAQSLDLDATPNYKALLKSYQDQLKDSKIKLEQNLLENVNLQKDLDTRPTAKELKLYKQQVKRLEKILHQNNINSRGVVLTKKVEENKDELESTRIEDLDRLQSNLCRRYLQSACMELNIQDLKDLDSVIAVRVKQSEAYSKLQQVLTSINSVVGGHKAPQLLYKQSSRQLQNCNNDANQKTGFEHLPPTIEMWADQLLSLKELHTSLQKLALKLVPTFTVASPDSNETVRVEDLQFLVDTIVEEEENQQKGSERISQQTLQSFVLHFQKLFDVTSSNGIFPRMNEVYMKLGEMSNAMRNLCNVLGLDDAAPPSLIVNMVGKLCSVINDSTNQQVQQLLGALDIDVIIRKLEEHDEFFPAFEALTRDLLQVLGVSHLDDILPAVHKLKVLAE